MKLLKDTRKTSAEIVQEHEDAKRGMIEQERQEAYEQGVKEGYGQGYIQGECDGYDRGYFHGSNALQTGRAVRMGPTITTTGTGVPNPNTGVVWINTKAINTKAIVTGSGEASRLNGS